MSKKNLISLLIGAVESTSLSLELWRHLSYHNCYNIVYKHLGTKFPLTFDEMEKNIAFIQKSKEIS